MLHVGLFRFFRAAKPIEADPQRVENCFANIRQKVSRISGVSSFIEIGDNVVAFAGTQDHPKLILQMELIKTRGAHYLYASMYDKLSWQEWDYKTQDAFEDSIVEFICGKIDRTIKTVTELKKHKYVRVTEYVLDKETGEWILLSDKKLSWLLIRLLVQEDSVTEEIEEY